jgi:hypothetical protein
MVADAEALAVPLCDSTACPGARNDRRHLPPLPATDRSLMPLARVETDPVVVQIHVGIRRSRLIAGTNHDPRRALLRSAENVLKPEIRARVEPRPSRRDLSSVPYDVLPSEHHHFQAICCQPPDQRIGLLKSKPITRLPYPAPAAGCRGVLMVHGDRVLRHSFCFAREHE